MTKLNDLQSLLLSHASQGQDGSLLALPTTYTAHDDRVGKAVASLLRRKLVEEAEVEDAEYVWRHAGDASVGLFITAAGLAAIGLEADDAVTPSAEASPPSPPRASKIAGVLALIGRPDGATLPEMIAATDWLPHTTRSALPGLRKKVTPLSASSVTILPATASRRRADGAGR